jgi:hypothetical protein
MRPHQLGDALSKAAILLRSVSNSFGNPRDIIIPASRTA